VKRGVFLLAAHDPFSSINCADFLRDPKGVREGKGGTDGKREGGRLVILCAFYDLASRHQVQGGRGGDFKGRGEKEGKKRGKGGRLLCSRLHKPYIVLVCIDTCSKKG